MISGNGLTQQKLYLTLTKTKATVVPRKPLV
jgi:hypothetical protein